MPANLKAPRRAKLKPCPFDGAAARLHTTGYPAHLPFSVRCTGCHARTTQFRVLGLAVHAWQTRVDNHR